MTLTDNRLKAVGPLSNKWYKSAKRISLTNLEENKIILDYEFGAYCDGCRTYYEKGDPHFLAEISHKCLSITQLHIYDICNYV